MRRAQSRCLPLPSQRGFVRLREPAGEDRKEIIAGLPCPSGPISSPIARHCDIVTATPYHTMDPNAGFPAGFPVPNPSPSNQMAYYQNSIPQYPQSKTPQQLGQQQHSFGAMPMQPGGPGGAMMPSGFPQQSSGTWCSARVRSLFIISMTHLSSSPAR